MKASLKEVKRSYRAGRYKEALSLLEKIEEEGLLHPDVLVWKGRCLQLDDGEACDELSEVEETFKQALDIDDEHVPAIVELAWFYLNVLDEPDRARGLFEKSVNLYKKLMTEAVIGHAKSLLEVESKDVALKYLSEIAQVSLDLKEVQEVREDIESFS